MKNYDTNVVAGVTPGKGGQEVCGIPVFNTIQEAQERVEREKLEAIEREHQAKHEAQQAEEARIASEAKAKQDAIDAAVNHLCFDFTEEERVLLRHILMARSELDNAENLHRVAAGRIGEWHGTKNLAVIGGIVWKAPQQVFKRHLDIIGPVARIKRVRSIDIRPSVTGNQVECLGDFDRARVEVDGVDHRISVVRLPLGRTIGGELVTPDVKNGVHGEPAGTCSGIDEVLVNARVKHLYGHVNNVARREILALLALAALER